MLWYWGPDIAFANDATSTTPYSFVCEYNWVCLPGHTCGTGNTSQVFHVVVGILVVGYKPHIHVLSHERGESEEVPFGICLCCC